MARSEMYQAIVKVHLQLSILDDLIAETVSRRLLTKSDIDAIEIMQRELYHDLRPLLAQFNHADLLERYDTLLHQFDTEGLLMQNGIAMPLK